MENLAFLQFLNWKQVLLSPNTSLLQFPLPLLHPASHSTSSLPQEHSPFSFVFLQKSAGLQQRTNKQDTKWLLKLFPFNSSILLLTSNASICWEWLFLRAKRSVSRVTWATHHHDPEPAYEFSCAKIWSAVASPLSFLRLLILPSVRFSDSHSMSASTFCPFYSFGMVFQGDEKGIALIFSGDPGVKFVFSTHRSHPGLCEKGTGIVSKHPASSSICQTTVGPCC